LRFRPMLPLLLRYVPRETILAKGTRDARSIKAGSSVIAGPLAVMFDPDEYELPAKFLGSRPLDSFVHFGFGPRTCFGKYVADTAMVEISRVHLKLPQLALGDGSSGRVAYDGPVADSLTVTFAPY
ncbi:cytochrome P450, partial [Herbaspirillum sp. HC18]